MYDGQFSSKNKYRKKKKEAMEETNIQSHLSNPNRCRKPIMAFVAQKSIKTILIFFDGKSLFEMTVNRNHNITDKVMVVGILTTVI
jgi:hypothetical protein